MTCAGRVDLIDRLFGKQIGRAVPFLGNFGLENDNARKDASFGLAIHKAEPNRSLHHLRWLQVRDRRGSLIDEGDNLPCRLVRQQTSQQSIVQRMT